MNSRYLAMAVSFRPFQSHKYAPNYCQKSILQFIYLDKTLLKSVAYIFAYISIPNISIGGILESNILKT